MTDLMNTTSRTRTFSWENPRQSARIVRKLSGLQTLDASLRGEFPDPPIAHLLGTSLIEAEYGWAVFTFTPAEFHCNFFGYVAAGMITTVVDSALGCAIQSTLPAGDYGVTQGLQLKFLRPLPLDAGPIRAEAEVILVGNSTATAQARVVDEDERQYVYATTTFLIYRR
ncbi:MAG: PaaI family thioesterase [Anaerolineae bacterium]|nr:PaaI family thioesterase [Anaerolineae bacterium]